ncbi:hypothetical protein K431DRAFT_289081 [Polychaeton citri CBS 116435]|uniref:BRCT domain-containing protein n=1 Tax=Polychaeton citri CBS 116435 TaxID=1314669 RepID=A0A9P4PZP6_9PEZI|nr:hypothetical protein K431DRAFT_289081 [Polychaeton citri CBS 116435]
MPPKKSQDVFIVTHCVLDSQQDDPCGTIAVSAYNSVDAANDAAHALTEQVTASNATSHVDEDTEDGGMVLLKIRNSAGNILAEVKVSQTTVLDSAPSKTKGKATDAQSAGKSNKKTSSSKSKAPPPEDEDEALDEDDDELDKPATKISASSKPSAVKKSSESRKQVADGRYGALAGVRILFTGTLQMDRNTCKKTAEEYGAQVISRLEDTDYIVLGTKAGPKKLEVIRENDLETISEEEFLELLQTGVPTDKRARMASKRAADEAEGPPAKKRSKKA